MQPLEAKLSMMEQLREWYPSELVRTGALQNACLDVRSCLETLLAGRQNTGGDGRVTVE